MKLSRALCYIALITAGTFHYTMNMRLFECFSEMRRCFLPCYWLCLDQTLLNASYEEDTEYIDYKIEQGFDVNEPLYGKFQEECHPLIYFATIGNRPKTVQHLIDKGSRMDGIGMGGLNLLHCAAWEGLSDMVSLFIKNGLDIHARSNKGSTALHLAAQNWRLTTIRTLIEHGADITICDNQGKTAIDRAQSHKRVITIQCDITNNYLKNVENYVRYGLIITKNQQRDPRLFPNYFLLAIHNYRHGDIEYCRAIETVTTYDLGHYLYNLTCPRGKEAGLRELVWIDLAQQNTTLKTVENNIVQTRTGYEVLTHYRLFYKMQRQEKCIDTLFYFK